MCPSYTFPQGEGRKERRKGYGAEFMGGSHFQHEVGKEKKGEGAGKGAEKGYRTWEEEEEAILEGNGG